MVYFFQSNSVLICSSGPKIFSQTVAYDYHRTSVKVVCKLKPNYYVQPQVYFYFQGGVLFSCVLECIASGTLHFYSEFSGNAFTGVESLVRQL